MTVSDFNIHPPPPSSTSSSQTDQTQQQGEVQSEGGGGDYAVPTTTYTTTDANGNIHTLVVDNKTGIVMSDKITGHSSKTGLSYGATGGGTTWYEQQQIALDKQRLKDAEAAQAAQLAYQHQQQLIAESNAVEAANQAFRDAQLKSTYGTINGMAYGAPKGSPFAQLLPEPLLLKQAYADNHQPDPWNQPAPYGGYTGQSYMNAQQPGLANQGDPNMQTPTTGPGSLIPTSTTTEQVAPTSTVSSNTDQMMQWHDLAHQIMARSPVTQTIPSMARGGIVPGMPGQPQLIEAHGGETIIPAPNKPNPTALGPVNQMTSGQIPGYANGGVVPDYSSYYSMPTDYNSFMAWHDGIHASQGRGVSQSALAMPGPKTPVAQANLLGPPVWAPVGSNAYGQTVNDSVVHSPFYNDIVQGPGVLNHMPYSPVLTGLSGYGATITPDGTPVVMSNWQRAHLMPSSVSGPGGYEDYAMQVADWSPTDLQNLGNSMTGNFGSSDLHAPRNYAPITIAPAPSGG